MSLPDEELQPQQTSETSTAVNSIAPGNVLEKMMKVPVVKQVREKLKPAETQILKLPQTMELSDVANQNSVPDYKEPTEAFVLRHVKPGTDLEGISSSHFYHDVAAIEMSLYTKYLKDEITLEEMESTKNHMAAINVHILRTEILSADRGEFLSQTSTRIVKELELGNVDPFMAEALIDLLNRKRRELAGFSQRLFLQEKDLRKLCEDAYKKTEKYKPQTSDHWTIAKAFDYLEEGRSDISLKILSLTREIAWPPETADLFWRKLRLSTFRQQAEVSLEELTMTEKLLEQISDEMKAATPVNDAAIKARWEDLSRSEAMSDMHEEMWYHGVAEGMRITTGPTHNDMAEKSGLPVAYDYSRFDPVTMWFLIGLHQKDSKQFHAYVQESERSGYNFWLSYIKTAGAQGSSVDTTLTLSS